MQPGVRSGSRYANWMPANRAPRKRHNDEDELGRFGEDIFPRNFIINLRPPSNYIGLARAFGLEETPSTQGDGDPGLPIVRIADDYEAIIPATHKKNLTPMALPTSLKQAIRAFVLSCAARSARGRCSRNGWIDGGRSVII